MGAVGSHAERFPTGAVKALRDLSDLFTLQIHLPEGAEINYPAPYYYTRYNSQQYCLDHGL
jgi:hypothetical protein